MRQVAEKIQEIASFGSLTGANGVLRRRSAWSIIETTAEAVLEKGATMAASHGGDKQLLEDIGEVVKKVTAPRFEALEALVPLVAELKADVSAIRADVSAILSRLPK